MTDAELMSGFCYDKPDKNGMVECPYSGAKVPWMCLRFCETCIQKTTPKDLRNIKKD